MSTDPTERVKDATATHTRRVSMQPEKMLRILSTSTHLLPPPPPTSTSKTKTKIVQQPSPRPLSMVPEKMLRLLSSQSLLSLQKSEQKSETTLSQPPSIRHVRPLSMMPEKMLELLSPTTLPSSAIESKTSDERQTPAPPSTESSIGLLVPVQERMKQIQRKVQEQQNAMARLMQQLKASFGPSSQTAKATPPPKAAPRMNFVPKDNWFTELFGVDESMFLEAGQAHAQFGIHRNPRGHQELVCFLNKKRYQIGSFNCRSVRELREHFIALPKTQTKGGVEVEHMATEDVMHLIADPANRHAFFQVASQFNCLEMATPANTPEDGIGIYEFDMTQGPRCAIAAGPATFYRNYLIEMMDGAQLGQSAHCQLNNLADAEALLSDRYWDVKNGYVFSDPQRLAGFEAAMATLGRERLVDAVKIGVQSHVEVVYKGIGARPIPCDPSQRAQIVSQGFCSAISCNTGGFDLRLWKALATVALDAAYEATLWSALLNAVETGKPLVYLTFVGAGAFKNKMEWILDAIARAVAKVRRLAPNATLRVVLVHYLSIQQQVVDGLDARLSDV